MENNGNVNFGRKCWITWCYWWVSLVTQMIKNPPAMRETWARSLDWGGLLEKEMTTHPSILAWRIPMGRGVWLAAAHGVTKSQTDWGTNTILKALSLRGLTLSHLYREKMLQNRQKLLSCWGLRGTLWPDLHGQLQEQRIPGLSFHSGGDVSIAMADPCWCMAETIAIL